MLSQWLFPLSSLRSTPTSYSLQRELYDRARGIEFLFRLGTSLGLPTSAIFTSATWFHRFYMRCSMEDFHRQDVAAACIFLATKTEECGRKLRDVAKVCQSKITGEDIAQIAADSKEVEQLQNAILMTEEVLLEALCFDFVVESPHAELVDLFDTYDCEDLIREYAWSLAHDSYRTPLCLLYPPRIIAAACFVLAQRVFDGPNSPALDARISVAAPSASLPTPPSNKPPSPDASRFAIEHFSFGEADLESVSEALAVLLEFYSVQDSQTVASFLSPILAVTPPTLCARPQLYTNVPQSESAVDPTIPVGGPLGRTPSSSHGGYTPAKSPSNSGAVNSTEHGRLDLS